MTFPEGFGREGALGNQAWSGIPPNPFDATTRNKKIEVNPYKKYLISSRKHKSSGSIKTIPSIS
jgi:hypothetical protein